MWQREPDITSEAIKKWVRNPEIWPTADSYDIGTLAPCLTLGQREQDLKGQMPEWFWKGEKGSSILSIGTGKGYFERKYWNEFDNIYVIDPSEWTRRALEEFSIPNAHFVSKSLFNAPLRLTPVPKYCWLGASIHHVFAEFYGWAFLRKLAMMVSDTLVVDAGVMDSEEPQGEYLLSRWDGESGKEFFEAHRRSQFSYEKFRESINGFWSVVDEWPTTWVRDGRRTLMLKRELPPTVQKDQLGPLELVCKREKKYLDKLSVFRTSEGYYRETKDLAPLLMYDALGKMMGWDGFVKSVVYEENEFRGFVVTNYGDQRPEHPSISETLYLALVRRCLPLGFLPTDVGAESIRVHNAAPIWIDIDCLSLGDFDPLLALSATTNTYKNYGDIPNDVDAAMYSGSADTTYSTQRGNTLADDSLFGCLENDSHETVNGDSATLSVHKNEALFVSQIVPRRNLRAGQRLAVTVIMKNIGNSTWAAGGEYRLGSQKPRDNHTWGLHRVSLLSSVVPGASATFSFTVTAPDIAGDYNFQWQMVQDGVGWFGGLSTYVILKVR